MFFVRGSKLTLFLCESKLLVFSMSMEIDLAFVMVVIYLISMWGIELDFFSVQGWL